MSLRIAAADDDEVLVDAARCGQRNRLLFPGLTQTFAKVDAATLTEARDRFASLGIQAIEVVQHAGEDALILAVRPVGDPASRLG